MFSGRYATIGVTWVLTRLAAILGVVVFTRLLDDIDIYREWIPLLDSGTFPIGDPLWQYPPATGPVLLAANVPTVDYPVSFVGLCLLVDLAIMVALCVAHTRLPDPSRMGLWMWALAGIVVGPIMLARFDLVPAFFAVIAVLLVARPAWSGVSAAVGFLVKVWPALMLLVIPRRKTWVGVISFVATILVLLVMIGLQLDGPLAFLDNQKARGLQIESTGAVPYWLSTFAGRDIATELEYGSMQIHMAGAETIGLAISIIGVGVLAVIGWWRLSGRLDSIAPADIAVPLVLVMVASSRVYSPQFNVWIIAIAAAATLSARSRMRTAAAILVGVSILTQFVYPMFPWNFTDGEPWIVLIQVARIAGLLLATALAIRELWLPQRSAQSATADAAATLSESTPPNIGMRTTTSAE